MSIVSLELNRNSFPIKHATYEYSKFVPNTGSTTQTITTSGGQETIFELSPKVFNFSRSILALTMTPTASGSGRYNWVYKDSISAIRQIQLYTRTGLYLVDVQDCNKYTNMTLRHETRFADMMAYDDSLYFEGLEKCNLAAASNERPTDAAGGQTSFLEPLYLDVGGDNGATPVVTARIDLGKIKNTLLSLDKDIYFGGEILYLRIVWAPSTQIAFSSASATDPTSTPAAYAQSIALSNIALYMSVEVNPDVENDMKKLVMSSGINLVVPVVHYNKQNLSSTSQNISLKYNNAHGARLLKILHAVYHNTESSNTAYDHDCLADAKVIDFYTMVNNRRTTQFNLDTSAGDDWMVRKQLLRGSCIFSADEYYYNWVNIENFCNPEALTMLPKDNYDPQIQEDGTDLLSQEVKWDCFMTTANNAHNHYIYAICQKYLTVGPAGISLNSVPPPSASVASE